MRHVASHTESLAVGPFAPCAEVLVVVFQQRVRDCELD